MVSQSIRTCCLWKGIVELERKQIPHECNSSNYQSILENESSMGRRIGEARDKLVSFWSARIVIETANYRLDRTRWWTINLRHAQSAKSSFHQSSSDAIFFVQKYVSKRTGQGCHLSRRSFAQKETSRRRLLATELTCTYQDNLKKFIYSAREKQNHFSFTVWRDESWILKPIDDDYRFDQ